MKRLLLIGFYCLLLPIAAQSQDAAPKLSVITADSLASGNYKDVFTSFFKLALNDITGPQKAISFTSNPYAIMARGNPSLTIDTNYVKYRHLRDINFNADVNFDSAYRLNGFTLGLKYAIINQRDVTVSRGFITQATMDNDLSRLRDAITAELSLGQITESQLIEINNWMNDQNVTFDSLTQSSQNVISNIIALQNLTQIAQLIQQNPHFNFRVEALRSFNALKDEWQRKPLWTIAASSVFRSMNGSNTPIINSAIVSSEFLWAFNSPQSAVSLEMDIIATDSMQSDNTVSSQNIAHNVFSFEPGINFVIKSRRSSGKSFFEFKLSGTYAHVFSNPYILEDVNNSTINAVVRIRIINDTWVPVTFKMDEHGHVYGSLGIKLNFNGLTNLLSRQ